MRSAVSQIVLVAVIRDLDPAHQFHDEVGPSGGGRARVQDPGDVGMVHHGQRLAFGLESRNHRARVHSQFDDFQRHPPPHGFGLFGHIHHSAAAFAQFLANFIAPDDVARIFGGRNSPRPLCPTVPPLPLALPGNHLTCRKP